jgi:hypothetical protein
VCHATCTHMARNLTQHRGVCWCPTPSPLTFLCPPVFQPLPPHPPCPHPCPAPCPLTLQGARYWLHSSQARSLVPPLLLLLPLLPARLLLLLEALASSSELLLLLPDVLDN